MRSKGPAFVKLSGEAIVLDGARRETHSPGFGPESPAALQSNIEDTLSEIEMLRGSLQYWEGRRPAADPKERAMLAEAFRVMHGELVGLTARAKALCESTEQAEQA